MQSNNQELVRLEKLSLDQWLYLVAALFAIGVLLRYTDVSTHRNDTVDKDVDDQSALIVTQEGHVNSKVLKGRGDSSQRDEGPSRSKLVEELLRPVRDAHEGSMPTQFFSSELSFADLVIVWQEYHQAGAFHFSSIKQLLGVFETLERTLAVSELFNDTGLEPKLSFYLDFHLRQPSEVHSAVGL
jgi:hypothetical protein